jgi:FkbM family methyltransferase
MILTTALLGMLLWHSIPVLGRFRTQQAMIESAMVHDANGYFSTKNMNDGGLLIDCRNNETAMEQFHEVKKLGRDYFYNKPGQDGETYDVVTRFFWGMRNGVSIELGATDGIHNSQTKYLADKLDWHRILIEANPETGQRLKQNADTALSFNTAICSNTRMVHFVSKGDVSGIVEFMSTAFIRQFHGELLGQPPAEWRKYNYVQQVPCLPLNAILSHSNITHVNYFLLDTEGAELDILRTINWSEVFFDIISVETERDFRPPGYEAKVIAYLMNKGYKMIERKGRNTWYMNKFFTPTVCPDCPQG